MAASTLLALVLAPAPAASGEPSAAHVPTDPTEVVLRRVPAYSDPVELALATSAGGLTAAAVARRAVASAPTIAQRRAELQAAAARVDQTLFGLMPDLVLSASYIRQPRLQVTFGGERGSLVGSVNPGPLRVGPCPVGTGQCVLDSGGAPVVSAPFEVQSPLDNYSTQAALTLPLTDYVLRAAKATRAAKESREAARLLVEAESLKVQTDARLVYYDWLRTVAQVAVSADAVERAKARERDARVSSSVGLLSEADVLRVTTQVANAERALVAAQALEEVAATNLAVIMDEPRRPYRVGEDVLGAMEFAPDTGDVDALMDEAASRRLEVRALQRESAATRDAAKAERAGYFPRLEPFAEATYANPNPRFFPPTARWRATWSAGARLTWDIGTPLVTRARTKELQARRRNIDAQVETLRRGLRMEVTQAWVARKNALAALALAAQAKRSTEVSYEAMADRFAVGKATATDLIQAEGERIEASLQDVNARIDLRVAETRLLYATGRLRNGR